MDNLSDFINFCKFSVYSNKASVGLVWVIIMPRLVAVVLHNCCVFPFTVRFSVTTAHAAAVANAASAAPVCTAPAAEDAHAARAAPVCHHRPCCSGCPGSSSFRVSPQPLLQRLQQLLQLPCVTIAPAATVAHAAPGAPVFHHRPCCSGCPR